MRALRVFLCVLVVVLGTRASRAAPDETAGQVDRLVAALEGMRHRGGAPDPALAKEVAELAATVSRTPEGVAALLKSGRFEVKVPTEVKVDWPGADAGVSYSGGAVTGTLPLSPITSASVTVGELKLGVGTSSKLIDLAGTEVKVGGGVEAEYANSKDFYAALPVPGMRHMHALLEHRLGENAKNNPEPEQQVGGGVMQVMEAAAREAAESFKASMGWVAPKQATFSNNVSVSHGPVEVTASMNTQVNFTQPDKFLGQSADVTFKIGKEASVGPVSAGAGLAFTYKFDREPKPPTPEALELASALEAHDTGRATKLLLTSMGPLALSEADLLLAKEVYEKAKDAASLAIGQVVQTVDPIGGVSLALSPSVAWSTPAEYGEVLRELGRLRAEGRKVFALQPGTSASLVRVPFDEATKQADLGLTRIRGYVVGKDGSLDLLGEREPGRTPIPRDDLVVALRAIYVEGLAPFVSLDPDPRDFAGAQKARVGGLPEALLDTAFVKVLLDADYLMKRLDLGALKVRVPGYRPSVDLLETWPDPPAELASRLWLVPEVAPVGDTYQAEDGRGRAVLFHSRVRVLTETLKRAGSTLLGTGESHPLSDAAAASLCAAFPTLARQRECADFARLEQVFDLAKLCALWRAQGVKHASLERVAALTPARVTHPDSYPGIGPVAVRGGTYSVSGGASARARLRARPPHALDGLSPVLTATSAEVRLPSTLPLDGSELHQVNAELLANASLSDLLQGRYAQALEQVERALAEDPELADARAYRALAQFALGNFTAALADAEVAAKAEPSLLALKAVVEAGAGKADEARADCSTAEARFAQDADVLAICAHARLLVGDFEGCEHVAQRLDALSPLSHDALSLRDQLDVLYHGTPAEAARQVARLRDIPLAVQNSVALAQEALASFQFLDAVEHLRTAEKAAQADPSPRSRALHVPELCRFLLAHALSQAATINKRLNPEAAQRQQQEAQEMARALAAEHPDWPSTSLLYANLAAGGLKMRERLKLLEDAAARSDAGDPLLDELQRSLGTRRVVALFALSMFMDQGKSRAPGDDAGLPEALRVMDLLVKTLGDTPEAAPYRHIRDLIAGAVKDPKAPEPGPEAMRPFAESILAIPRPWSNDAVSVMATAHLHMIGVGITGGMDHGESAQKNPNRDLVPRFLAAFFHGARLNGLREGSLKQVSTLYWTFSMVLASSLSQEVRASARFKALEERVKATLPDLDAVRKEVATLQAELLEAKKKELPPFAVAMAGALGFLGIDSPETQLRDVFAIAIEKWPEQDQQRARDLLQTWEDVARPKKGDLGAFERIGKVAEQATCEVELAAVLNMLELFGMAASMAGEESPEAAEMARRFRALTQGIQTRIKGRVFEPAQRDWAAWRGGKAPPPGSPPPSPADAQKPSDRPGWLWPGAGGALVVVIAAFAAARRRRRRAA